MTRRKCLEQNGHSGGWRSPFANVGLCADANHAPSWSRALRGLLVVWRVPPRPLLPSRAKVQRTARTRTRFYQLIFSIPTSCSGSVGAPSSSPPAIRGDWRLLLLCCSAAHLRSEWLAQLWTRLCSAAPKIFANASSPSRRRFGVLAAAGFSQWRNNPCHLGPSFSRHEQSQCYFPTLWPAQSPNSSKWHTLGLPACLGLALF